MITILPTALTAAAMPMGNRTVAAPGGHLHAQVDTHALFMGLVYGLIHVVGPDHLGTLMTLSSAAEPSRAFRVGAAWGLGHSFGMVLVAATFIAFHKLITVDVSVWEHYGNYFIGASLMACGLYFIVCEDSFLKEQTDGTVVAQGCACHGAPSASCALSSGQPAAEESSAPPPPGPEAAALAAEPAGAVAGTSMELHSPSEFAFPAALSTESLGATVRPPAQTRRSREARARALPGTSASGAASLGLCASFASSSSRSCRFSRPRLKEPPAAVEGGEAPLLCGDCGDCGGCEAGGYGAAIGPRRFFAQIKEVGCCEPCCEKGESTCKELDAMETKALLATPTQAAHAPEDPERGWWQRAWSGRDAKGALLGVLQGFCCPLGMLGMSFMANLPAVGIAAFLVVFMFISAFGTASLAAAWAALTTCGVGSKSSPRIVYRVSCWFTLLLGTVWIAANHFGGLDRLDYTEALER